MAVELTLLHYIYLIGVVVTMAIMISRRSVVIPCIIFTFALGIFAQESFMGGVTAVYNALLYAATEFFGIIATIGMIVAMSKSMADQGTDVLIVEPVAKYIKNPTIAFFGLGLTMFLLSLLIWPSPAVALVGAILTPIAIRAGLPAIGAAMAMNLFGHGFAMSIDPIIQGAPGITAASAGIQPLDIIKNGMPIFITVGVVAALLGYLSIRKDMKINAEAHRVDNERRLQQAIVDVKRNPGAKLMSILIPVAFLIMIVLMLTLDLIGGEATALVTFTAIVLMILGTILNVGVDKAFEQVSEYVKDGFSFGMMVFAPVVVIGGFFFIGGSGMAPILGIESDTGLLVDWAMWLSNKVPLSKIPVAIIMVLSGSITGIAGSGFSGLPLAGSLAGSFGTAVGLDPAILGTLGQIGSVWVGGGTIIPWAVIPVAAMCQVDATELCRRNFWPTILALAAGLVVSFFLL